MCRGGQMLRCTVASYALCRFVEGNVLVRDATDRAHRSAAMYHTRTIAWFTDSDIGRCPSS